MYQPVGICSLAVSFPSIKRTNDYYKEKYPEKVAQAQQETLCKVFTVAESTSNSRDFDREMLPYLSDPFRGTVERYVLGSEESLLTLEEHAAKDALQSARLAPQDIELMLVASMFPEQIMIGNASFLVNRLSLSCPAWNLESTQSGGLIGLQTACSLVRTGEYRNVLVVVSCAYSRVVDENNTLSWITGDGAGAFVVSSLKSNQGILGTKVIHTAVTCDACSFEVVRNKQSNLRVRLQVSKKMSKLFRENIVKFIRETCEVVIAEVGITLDQIDFFVFSTPFAWFARLFTVTLNIDPERTLNLYPHYANIGSVLPIANLYYATLLDKIRENSLVLVFSFGASSTAAATIMRWGDVALSPASSVNGLNLVTSSIKNNNLALCS